MSRLRKFMEYKVNRLEQANHILYDLGLLNELNKYGKAHIIGSVRMNLMAWNDLDIDVKNDSMSLEKLHQLTNYILNNFNPTFLDVFLVFIYLLCYKNKLFDKNINER